MRKAVLFVQAYCGVAIGCLRAVVQSAQSSFFKRYTGPLHRTVGCLGSWLFITTGSEDSILRGVFFLLASQGGCARSAASRRGSICNWRDSTVSPPVCRLLTHGGTSVHCRDRSGGLNELASCLPFNITV